MVEASHSLVIQITQEEIKEKACQIQKQVIGHDVGMADYIVKPEELHITLAMLQIEDAEGIEMVKKIITDNADDLKGAIIRIGGISTFSQDHVLYAKVVTLPSNILGRLSSVIKKRVSQCSQKVQLIEKQQQEEYVHHHTVKPTHLFQNTTCRLPKFPRTHRGDILPFVVVAKKHCAQILATMRALLYG